MCIDEFVDKTYPEDLDSEDKLIMNGHSFTVDELMCFIKEQYSKIVKGGLNVTDIDYIGILDYLRDNIEVPYSNPEETGIDPEEKARLYEVEEKGRAATTELKKMTAEFGRMYKLNKALPISWLDGSKTKTRKYLSAQMKYSDYSDNPSSISIFVEKNGPSSTRYRISLEIKSDGTDKRSMAKYHSHLDMSCNTAAGLVYVSGSNEWGNPAELTETQKQIKVQVESGDLRKVQICKCIERKDDETNEYYHNEISKAIAALIPYYDHVIGKISTTTDKGWLMTWNPANWEWEGFDKLCVETKNGKTHIEAWNCSSKQPVIGDDVFLMKTGEQPRGIMAHGHIAKASYTAPHYDPEKNVAGVTTGYVDVEFDWIQNYKSEKLLIQDILKKKFPTQNWSPIGSGIEIKECLPELKAMWVELIGKNWNVEITIEDYNLYKLGFVEEIPCSISLNVSREEICELQEEILDMEVTIYSYEDILYKNPMDMTDDEKKIYKKLQELEKRYNKFQPLENLFSYYLAINGKEI